MNFEMTVCSCTTLLPVLSFVYKCHMFVLYRFPLLLLYDTTNMSREVADLFHICKIQWNIIKRLDESHFILPFNAEYNHLAIIDL